MHSIILAVSLVSYLLLSSVIFTPPRRFGDFLEIETKTEYNPKFFPIPLSPVHLHISSGLHCHRRSAALGAPYRNTTCGQRDPNERTLNCHCRLATACRELPTAACLLATGDCCMPTAACLLPTAYCQLLTPLPHFTGSHSAMASMWSLVFGSACQVSAML